MDDQYLDAFIRESEEGITELNNSLLDLESNPSDQEAMEQIFRTAHTLKGNFGAMGFVEGSNLAHAMEDLLDEIREGNLEVTPEIMDLIFAGVDQIEGIVTQIDSDGESTIDTSATVEQFRHMLESEIESEEESGKEDGRVDPAHAEAKAIADLDLQDLDVDPTDVEDRVIHGEITIGESAMPAVDALIVLEEIDGEFDVLTTVPDRAMVEDGEYDQSFSILVDAPDGETVESSLAAIGKVDSVSVEDVTDELRAGGSVADEHTVHEIKSVRVDVEQLDDLHGMVEQLVTSRIKLRRAVEDESLDAATDTLNELDKITASLQNTVMDMRLIPLNKVVGKFPRMVRDLSRDLGKDVRFETIGEDIELDRTILTEISDPLMHIIRNALDHGIESPEERVDASKPPEGQVTLRASRERDHVIIEVEDDGAGLDREEIVQTAIKNGLRTADEIDMMDDSAIYSLIFHPGFSTAEVVTDTSGRGVGMDVVYDTVTRLDGSVSVDSTPGEGTVVSLRLPVTMAIVKVLFVEVGEEEYGIPIKNVDEITDTDAIKEINGQAVIKHNDEIYPIIDLAERFDVPGRTAATDGGSVDGEGMLVRIRESERQVALRCDSVTAQEEVVVKPLEGILSGTAGLSGTAVLGDGKIVHILDVVTL